MTSSDPNEQYAKLNTLARIVKKFTNFGYPWDVKKFYERMLESGSLEDFINIFFNGNFYLLSTKLYQFKMQNLVYTLTVPFHESRGAGVIPVFMTNTSLHDAWTRLGFFYMSRSQAVWRLLPLTIYGWYEKGEHGQHSLTAPWELQLALDSTYMAMSKELARRGLSFPQISARMFTMHAEVKEKMKRTISVVANHEPVVRAPHIDNDNPKATFEIAITNARGVRSEKKPNINDKRNSLSQEVEWPVYGRVKRALVYSRDSSLRYLFILSQDGVFLGGVDLAKSGLSNYGVRAEYPARFPKSFLVPLFEYPSEVPFGARTGEFHSNYVKVLDYHNEVLSELFTKKSDYDFLKNKVSGASDDARMRMKEVDQRLSRTNSVKNPKARERLRR